MIESLRFVWGSVPAPELGENVHKKVRILQYSDGSSWFDVPFVEDEPFYGEQKDK